MNIADCMIQNLKQAMMISCYFVLSLVKIILLCKGYRLWHL